MFIKNILNRLSIAIAVSIIVMGVSHPVFAEEIYTAKVNALLTTPLPLLQATTALNATDDSALSAENTFKESWFTANKWHQYFGLGSLALATLTAIVPKPSADDPETGIHPTLANSAAILGGAAVASGLVFHYEDLSWKNFTKNPDNWHALLGVLGTLGYVAAIADAPDGNHATYGIVGAVSMLAAIKITW